MPPQKREKWGVGPVRERFSIGNFSAFYFSNAEVCPRLTFDTLAHLALRRAIASECGVHIGGDKEEWMKEGAVNAGE